MNSFWKGVLHSVASAVILFVTVAHPGFLDLTIGGLVTIAANWLLSHSVPTTSGASARQ